MAVSESNLTQPGLVDTRLSKLCPPSFAVRVAANNNASDAEIDECLRSHLVRDKNEKPRKADRRLWDSFSDDQIRAAQLIYTGFKMRVSGADIRTQVFSCMPRGHFNLNNTSSDLLEKFAIWSREAHESGISIGCILDIVVFGKSCREVDREHCKRKGFAKKNLLSGLDGFRGFL